MKLKTITTAIEEFAPLSLQLDYDNSGLQIGRPDAEISAALLCLDVTEEILQEAIDRKCELIISHHPLLFRGLKHITGATSTERIVARALRHNIAIYAAHTNLDSAVHGVSREMARMLRLRDTAVLDSAGDPTGLGIIGSVDAVPAMEFLRQVKETFHVKALRYSAQSPQLVVRRVALCGGAGAEFIPKAIAAGADIYITGDVKYHDYTTYAADMLIVDIGHYESELCARNIFARLLHERFPGFVARVSESDRCPVGVI